MDLHYGNKIIRSYHFAWYKRKPQFVSVCSKFVVDSGKVSIFFKIGVGARAALRLLNINDSRNYSEMCSLHLKKIQLLVQPTNL